MAKYNVNDLTDNQINQINDDFFYFWMMLDKSYNDINSGKTPQNEPQKIVRNWLAKMTMNYDWINVKGEFKDKNNYCSEKDVKQAKHVLEVLESFESLQDKEKTMAFTNAVVYFIESENAANGF